MELAQIQQQARCNWCLNALINTTEIITEDNFVTTGKKWNDEAGTPAQALYCNECLASEFRTTQPKAAINRQTLDQANIERLQDA